MCNLLPMVALGPLGGSLADRFARPQILLVTQSLATLVSALFGTLWLVGVRTPWAYLVGAALSGSVSGINLPAWQSIVGDLVPRELMMNAVTLNSTQFNASRALGPAIGGVALAQLGPAWCFYINTASYAFVLYALVRLQRRAVRPAGASNGARSSVREDIAITLRAVRENRALGNAMVAISIVALLGYPIPSLIVFFQEDVYGAPRWVLGVLTASIGVGAIAIAPNVSQRAQTLVPSRFLPRAMMGYAAMTVVFGASSGPIVGGLALLVMGAAHLAVTSTLFTVVQLGVDPTMRGKVMAGYLIVLNVSTMLGSMVLGALIDVIGPRATVVGAGAVFGGAVLWLVWSRKLRPLDTATSAAAAPLPS